MALGVSLAGIALWSGAGAAGPAATPTAALLPVGPTTCTLPHGRPCQWPWAASGETTPFGQGAYVDPGRTQHVPEYRLRVDDVVDLVYRRTHEETGPYQLNVGDRIRVELPPGPMGAETVNREVVIQPDGNITLPNLEPVRAARLTIANLAASLGEKYREIYKEHMAKKVTVTPILIDAKLADLINT